MSTEQQLFQETPKETDACTLVTDTPASNKVREEIKKLVFKKLKPKDDDYEIVENQFQWSITQRYASKPAIINVRLRSLRKGMKLTAYNSFEIYHGNCSIANMRVRNDLENKKLEQHVDDAIKSFKEQAEFSKDEVIQFKKEHAKQLKIEAKLNQKLSKDLDGLDLRKNKDGLIKIFKDYHYYYEEVPTRRWSSSRYDRAQKQSTKGEFVQLVDVVKCNRFTFAPKLLKQAEAITDKLPDGIKGKPYLYITAEYSAQDSLWDYEIHDMTSKQAFELYNANSKGFTSKYWSQYNKKFMKKTFMPTLSIDTNPKVRFSHCANTKDFIKLVNKFDLKVWKIRQD